MTWSREPTFPEPSPLAGEGRVRGESLGASRVAGGGAPGGDPPGPAHAVQPGVGQNRQACPELVEGFEKKWGKFLANLKDDREAGDYEALSYLDEQTAGHALAEAEKFVEQVEEFLGQRSK